MSNYRVIVSRSAEKELQKLPGQVIAKIITALQSLMVNPRPNGCKKLKGFKDLWRIRIGDYRIIYSINDVVQIIDVRNIGNRKDIYE